MAVSLQFAPIYPVAYRVLKPLFPTCLWSGNSRQRAVALTFDDGPHPQHTPQLLQVLEHHRVQATFFWLGLCVERSPQLAKAIYDQGHWIALHGYDHRSFTTLSDAELRHSLHKARSIITQTCGLAADAIVDVRPPNGLFTPKTLDVLIAQNYRPVMWSVVPEDWVTPGVAIVLHRILKQVKNGSIIVLHDGYYGGVDVAQIVDRLIPLLQQQGYEFVSIDQLWRSHPGDRRQTLVPSPLIES